MVINFRASEISRNAHKLTRTPILIIKKKTWSLGWEDFDFIWELNLLNFKDL
jgi:hypothetical protein